MHFSDECDLVAYVEQHLRNSTPSGWSVQRESQDSLVWEIVSDQPASAPLEYFRLRVTCDFRLFLFEHDNSDMGAYGLHQVLLNAKVINAEALNSVSLSDVVNAIFENCRPNQAGLT